jgi:hypothetical protein
MDKSMIKSRQKGGNKITDKDLLFYVSEKNMVFSNETCFQKQALMVKTDRNLIKKMEKQKEDFISMFKQINNLVNEMISLDDDGQTELRVLTHLQLNVIEIQAKRLFMVFYLQSITNYNIILNTAEKMPKLNSTEE